jgi:pimeloyl-ACP methyl ester carboxylesterase
MEDHMPTLDAPGAPLHYRTAGDGPPLVLVHGSCTDMTTWDGVVDDLARDHRVIVYDRRGYGQSLHEPVRDHRLHARDLTLLLQEVASVPATVVGWSSGGNVALAAAVKNPELFRALGVVEAPFHGLRHADRTVLATALRLKLTQWRGRPIEAVEAFLRFGSALRSGGNVYDMLDDEQRNALLANYRPVLAEWDPYYFGVMAEHVPLRAVVDLPVPLTWILGAESAPWIGGLHARVARHRPDMRTVVIPGASHLVHIERPAEFVSAVQDISAGRHVPPKFRLVEGHRDEG